MDRMPVVCLVQAQRLAGAMIDLDREAQIGTNYAASDAKAAGASKEINYRNHSGGPL